MGFGEDNAYNFGPMDNYDLTVIEVVKLLQDKIPFEFEIDEIERKHYESELLSLDSELARRKLGWRSIYTQHEAISKTADWWQLYFQWNIWTIGCNLRCWSCNLFLSDGFRSSC